MMDFEEFERKKRALKYRGSDEDLKREYEMYVRVQKERASDSARAVESTPGEFAPSNPFRSEFVPAPAPFLSTTFYILAALSLLGGIVLAINFWPGDPGFGNEWKPVAYSWSILWISSSIVEAGFFSSIALALTYLKQIAANTRP